MASKPRVVVVGAGLAGAKTAKHLQASGKFDVTVIAPRNYLEIPFAAVRAVVSPVTAERSLIPISALAIGKFVRGTVQSVHKTKVVLTTGEEYIFDYLIIASGSTHSGHGVISGDANDIEARQAEFKAIADKIKNAKSIAVVGGGPVGIEVVGEIVETYAGKEVAIIHTGSQFLEGKDAKMHNYLMELFKKHKVKALLSERADSVDDAAKTLTTKTGKVIPAEVVIWAAGARPNTSIISAGGELNSVLDAKGLIKVDENLRLEGYSNIFALGDTNNTPGAKLGYLADMQAALTAGNLIKLASGSKALTKWNPPMQPAGAMFVSFGKNDGVGHAGGCICRGWPVPMLKSKDLFVGKARGDFGLK